MTHGTTLLFGVHAHQPTGNFPEVFDHAHERCYRPFLQTMHRYPEFRYAAHFSGPLLDYLLEHYPADMRLLEEMVARGQVELFGAGDTEPVLAAIPARDRVGQVERLSQKLQARFGQRPQGAWLTERVWDSAVVPALADCGIRYVTVDDYHFLCTGRKQAELSGFFTTEEDGRRLDLFPISEALRYRFPFAPAAEAVAYMEGLASDAADRATNTAVYFDDIEKFGIWPETYDWVYTRRWLEQFIEQVLASPRLKTSTFSAYHEAGRTRGVVYLPTVSYVEMNEWTLTHAAAATYTGMLDQAKAANRYETEKPFLRGGTWKNFLSRYPEANWMHKRMLALSARLAEQPQELREPLLGLLYGAQANDAYWHGLFGGLYLPHLRRGVYRNLVALEAELDLIAPRASVTLADFDYDGVDELFLHNRELQAIVRLDGSASVAELDDYGLEQNFCNTLRRHAEHYHRKIGAGSHEAGSIAGIASAHDRVSFKHAIAPSDAEPDPEAQGMLRDRWIGADGTSAPVATYVRAVEKETGPVATFRATLDEGRSVTKRLSIEGSRLTARYTLEGFADGEFHTVLAIAMPSCDGVAGRYVFEGRIAGGFGQPFDGAAAGELLMEDLFMGGSVTLRAEPPARVSARPYHTVSQSEEGFERIMQAPELVVAWRIAGPRSVVVISVETAKF